MKFRILAAIGAAVAMPLSAQSIEQSYASQCSNGEESETCAVLRAAMLEKLTKQNGGAEIADSAAVQTNVAPRWGFLLDLMKEPHVYVLGKGMRDMAYVSPIVTYTWKEPGKVILVSSQLPGGPNVETATLHWDSSRGAIIETTIEGGAETALLPQSDGSFVAEVGQARVSYRKSLHGAEQVVEAKSATGWDLLWRYDLVPFTPETLGLLRQIHENNIAVAKINASIPAKYHDPEYLRQAQEEERQRQARKKSNGGLFGALVGAAVGAYAGTASGMDAGQTADLMMRGAAATSGNSGVGQALAKGWAEETAKNEALEQSMSAAAGSAYSSSAPTYNGSAQTSQATSVNNSAPAQGAPASSLPAATHGTSNAVALVTKGFRVPITPNAASNEMCFAMINLGPLTDDPDKSYSARRIAVDQYLDQFLANCSTLGELGNGHSFNDIHFDDKANTYYGQFRANRWMHEVEM